MTLNTKTLLAGLVLALASTTASADAMIQKDSPYISYVGCYKSDGGMKNKGGSGGQSSSTCKDQCGGSAGFALTNGRFCYCGDTVPSESDKVSDSKCDTPCKGYDLESCGGQGFFLFYALDDSNKMFSTEASSTATSTSASSSTKTSSSTDATTTSDKSSSSSTTGSASSTSSSQASSTSDADEKKTASGIGGGAIAGIVVGIVGALAIIGGVFVFLKKRKSNDEYNPSSSPHGFTDPYGAAGKEGKDPFRNGSTSTSGGTSFHTSQRSAGGATGGTAGQTGNDNFMAIDQRLNPVMLGERRISDGSLADEEDYSRKILRVANPDA